MHEQSERTPVGTSAPRRSSTNEGRGIEIALIIALVAHLCMIFRPRIVGWARLVAAAS